MRALLQRVSELTGNASLRANLGLLRNNATIAAEIARSWKRDQGVRAALVYLMTYAFTNLGAFGVVIAMERNDGTGLELADYNGLAKQRPGLALVMAYFMLSLIGIPLTGGFIGKNQFRIGQ